MGALSNRGDSVAPGGVLHVGVCILGSVAHIDNSYYEVPESRSSELFSTTVDFSTGVRPTAEMAIRCLAWFLHSDCAAAAGSEVVGVR